MAVVVGGGLVLLSIEARKGMELKIICDSPDLDTLKIAVNQYFGEKMRLIRSKLSIFEAYEIRPVRRVHIPGVWEFRAYVHEGRYYFGKK